MFEKPRIIIQLVLLWLAISALFVAWGGYTFTVLLDIPTWSKQIPEIAGIVPILHFGYTLSTIVFFVFAGFFIMFAYGTFTKDHWVWTTGVIISTIFLAVFGLMLASFMVNALLFLSEFSVLGLISVVVAFLVDLGIIYHLTRPATRLYFDVEKK